MTLMTLMTITVVSSRDVIIRNAD